MQSRNSRIGSEEESLQEEEDDQTCFNPVLDRIDQAAASYNTHLCIAGMKVLAIPECLLNLTFLQFLYASRNCLETLPDGFFACLPSLKWLDLRQNLLAGLPSSGLEQHACLQYLLLEDNRIGSLPPALGCVRSLRGLSLSDNPLLFPEAEVVARGIQFVKHYLREVHESQQAADDTESQSSADKLLPTIGAGSTVIGRQSRDHPPEEPAANRRHPRGRLHVNPCPSPARAGQSEATPEAGGPRGSREAALQRRRRAEAARQWREEAKRLQAMRIRDQLLQNAMAMQLADDCRIADDLSGAGFDWRRLPRQRRRPSNQLTPAEEVEAAKRNVQNALAMQRQLENRGARLQRRALGSDTEEPTVEFRRGERLLRL